MPVLGPLGFAAPWLLVALVVLPVLWVILRAVPPAPVRRRFPGVALLLGLKDGAQQSARTPWWLLLVRLLAVAALITGFAGPVLSPQTPQAGGTGPLLVLADASWADAPDRDMRRTRIAQALGDAGREGRPVALVLLTDPPAAMPDFADAQALAATAATLTPAAWEPQPDAVAAFAAALEGDFDTLWLSDGLARDSRDGLLAALRAHGTVRVVQSPAPVLALRAPLPAGGGASVTILRSTPGPEADIALAAIGPDPAGVERVLASATATFADGTTMAEALFDLPPELRNRLRRVEIVGQPSAGAVALTGDTLARREIALVAGTGTGETPQLLTPLHYLRQALAPSADLIEGQPLAEVIPANPDVIILADVATIPADEAQALRHWVESGGLLLRFAGPRLAAAGPGDDPLLPVRLRAGGRSLGGTMSWDSPRKIAPFPDESPFHGLHLPDDVTVTAQVLAEPDPDLSAKVIATLTDGTPLVTRAALGQGRVVLFHVTANAEWSSIPLSGLFVQMLQRLAVTAGGAVPDAQDLAGTSWVPDEIMDARGVLTRTDTAAPVTGEALATGIPGPGLPPGLYAGTDRRLALNAVAPDRVLAAAQWPASVRVEGLEQTQEMPLKGWLLALAVLLMAADAIGSLAVSGRLSRVAPVALAGLALVAAPQADAQDATAYALQATDRVTLAYVVTGDARVDEMSRAGLAGLGRALAARTAVEPGAPMAVDLEHDEIAFFPLLYWPVTADEPLPSAEAYRRLNRYLQTGGMILFDTRDAGMAGLGDTSPEGRRLQVLAAPLDIPPLAPLPPDHVLTRTFYLLHDFPGRHAGGTVWAEAPPPDAAQVEGVPFRTLNDGVTPVVIGSADWAAAWAVDDSGAALVPVGRGQAGERQREMAIRFGINLVMHVLTGNYKSDQVHVADLLERLGQ
ncbi:MAG: DUF4159 domain-containing protein [Rubellimicrobium sp.]|nr:DUF4159 domain-containing protein [Rubellimicrobium sp.]